MSNLLIDSEKSLFQLRLFLAVREIIPYPMPFRMDIEAEVIFLFEDEFILETVKITLTLNHNYAIIAINDSPAAKKNSHHSVYSTQFHNIRMTRDFNLAITGPGESNNSFMLWIKKIAGYPLSNSKSV